MRPLRSFHSFAWYVLVLGHQQADTKMGEETQVKDKEEG